MSQFTIQQKVEGKARFAEIYGSLSRMSRGQLKHRLKRLNRLNATHTEPELELVSFADKFARQQGFTKELISQIRLLKSPDGMPFNRRQANFDALTEQMQFFLKPDVPNRYYNPDYRKAIETLREWARQQSIVPYPSQTEQDCDKLITNKSAICGWLAIEQNLLKDQKGQMQGRYLELRESLIRKIKTHENPTFPIVWIGKVDAMPEGDSFTRKLRGVNPVDLRVSLVSAPYAKAVDDVVHQVEFFGPGKTIDWLNQEIWHNRGFCQGIILSDYSKFDSTQPAWLLYDVFSIFRDMFEPGSVDDEVWEYIVRTFVHKTYITYDGEDFLAFQVHHGNISGHDFTTAVNCMVNLIIWLTICNHYNLTIQPNFTGDDSIVFVKSSEFELDDNFKVDMCDYVTKMFGITMKPKSTEIITDVRNDYPTYLSIVWTPNGPSRDVRELVSKLAWPRYPRPVGERERALQFSSYCQCYPVTMREFYDVDRFYAQYGLTETDLVSLSSADLDSLPYFYAEKVRRLQKETLSSSYNIMPYKLTLWETLANC